MSGGSGAGPPPLPVIGLTGAPGSGKSAVAALLSERGGVVVDADRLARAASGETAVLAAVERWWGPGVILETGGGGMDRAAVGRIVFADPVQRQRLEALIHPRVAAGRSEAHAAAQRDPDARFLVEDCPLLLESGLDAACDAVWLVDAPRGARLSRVRRRSWDAAELDRREAVQASAAERLARADTRLGNGGSPDDLARGVDAALRGFLERFPESHPGGNTG